MKSKLLSLVVLLGYLIMAFTVNGAAVTRTLVFMLLPIGFIWFGSEAGSIIGNRRGYRFNVVRESPGSVVAFLGWFFLLLPLVISIYLKIRWGVSLFELLGV